LQVLCACVCKLDRIKADLEDLNRQSHLYTSSAMCWLSVTG